MKNFFKSFITCALAACLIATTVFAGACTPNNSNGGEGGGEVHTDPTKYGYSITVLYPDGTPVKGSDGPSTKAKVGVQLRDASNTNDIKGTDTVVNEYGKANINYKVSGVFLIDVYNFPNGFEYADKVYTVEGRGDYTVKLSPKPVSYTINLKLPDDTPAIGVTVNIKKDSVLVKSATTDANGTAVLENVTADTYDLEFLNLPENISYLPVQVTAKQPVLTIELISLKELKLDEVMSAEKLDEWDKLANSYSDEAPVIRFNRTADCYDFTTDFIPEGKKIYYYFTADKDGTYNFISRGQYYTVEFFGNNLSNEALLTTKSTHESSNTCEMVELPLKEGEKYYFSYSIPERSNDPSLGDPDEHPLSGTREFMIAKPVAGVKRHEISGPGDYTIEFETDTALLIFITPMSATPERPSPTDGGIFEICSHTSEYDVEIIHYARLADNSEIEGSDDDSGEGKNFKYTLEVPPSYTGNYYYFKIKIKSKIGGGEVEYPTQVPIAITRIGNAEENFSPVYEKNATATEKYADQNGKTFHFLLGNNNSISEEDFTIEEKNGGYYVNIDGTEYELVVAITKNICSLPYSYATIEYMGAGSVVPGGPNSDDGMSSTPSDTRQNSYLTLYTDPSKGEDKTNPRLNYTPFIEQYATLCNSDGVYKLNAELKEFVEKYYIQHSQDFIFGLGLAEGCWLISCGYYA